MIDTSLPERRLGAIRRIPDEAWDFWWEVGRRRSIDHLNRKTSEYVHPMSHELGAIGEFFFGWMVNMRAADDLNPVSGDDGIDFPNCDVKAAEFFRKPWLKVRVDKVKEKPTGFLFPLIAIDSERRIGRYCGYATKEMLIDLKPSRIKLNPKRAASISGRPRSEEFGPWNYTIEDETKLIRRVPPGFAVSMDFVRAPER